MKSDSISHRNIVTDSWRIRRIFNGTYIELFRFENSKSFFRNFSYPLWTRAVYFRRLENIKLIDFINTGNNLKSISMRLYRRSLSYVFIDKNFEPGVIISEHTSCTCVCLRRPTHYAWLVRAGTTPHTGRGSEENTSEVHTDNCEIMSTCSITYVLTGVGCTEQRPPA